jgi:hypothetical protein
LPLKKQETKGMRVELFNYGRYRYMLCGPADLSPGERYETELDALKAGAKLFADRNERHWASQPDVVGRIRTFLHKSIPWHLSGQWEHSPREIVTCLCRCAVVILRAQPAYIAHDGFVPTRRDVDYQDDDVAQRIKAYADRSAAHAADFASYTQAVDERARASKMALTPFRHIETIAEAGARNLAARSASGGLAALAPSVGSIVSAVTSLFPSLNVSLGDGGALAVGDVSEFDARRTPLGDAAPFRYIESARSAAGDTVAGVFLTPAEEAECMFQYNLDMAECSAYYSMQKTSWGMCSDRASQRLARCVTGKGIM